MAKAQKRGTKEARKPKKTQAKPATPLVANKNTVKLTENKSA